MTKNGIAKNQKLAAAKDLGFVRGVYHGEDRTELRDLLYGTTLDSSLLGAFIQGFSEGLSRR